jgi:prepilin-type N-terminal cleavage/methylation domain-containing protein
MNKTSPTPVQGFTLIEMTVVLLLITLLASVAIRETNSLSFQVRYEQTQERLERIREAILGNPRQIINGQQAISGFVADMGRLPENLHELLEQNFCSDRKHPTKTACENAGKTWNVQTDWQPHSTSGLWYGWRGPYLNISGSALDDDAFVDGWGRLISDKTDQNYGWRVEAGLELNTPAPHPTSSKRMVIQSYGKDHKADGADYDADYPSNRYSIDDTIPFTHPAPLIDQEDWLVDISGGISISFIKPYNPHPIVSRCSDPTKSTKSDCTSPEIWYGGCDQAGYYNKTSCEELGNWFSCSDGTNTPRLTCESAGKIWYGEGYGCADQSKTTKADCEAVTKVWRSCTDNGTITEKNACDVQNEIWFGDTIYTIPLSGPYSNYSTKNICMVIFYRANGTLNRASSSSVTIEENGSYQELRFSNFDTSPIPIGKNAIGIYEYDGNCDPVNNPLYPADRQNPIQVDFHPRTGLPVINW